MSRKPMVSAAQNAERVRKLAERMNAPRSASAIARAKKAAEKLCLKPRCERGAEPTPKWADVKRHVDNVLVAALPMRSADAKVARFYERGDTTGEWRHGPDGPVYVSTEGWDSPDKGKRSVVAREGRIHNTPVGSAMAEKRPDSPFKRAKAAASKVVIIRKGE